MYLDFTSSGFLTITYNCETQMLVGRWLRPVTLPEARRGYDELLTVARQQQAHYWLLDIRRRNRSAPETLHWLLTTYYETLVAELGAPVCMVYFMSPDLRKDFEVDGTVPEPDSYAGKSFRMNQCTTEAEAVAWLLQEREQETHPLLSH
ncbi:MAG: hypothetical protein H7Z21_01580 [Hymenobacter sp.]|nr:hypothetical protein [Hymenobacter sp.]